MPKIQTILRRNFESVQHRMERACRVCGRSPTDVQLVAVTKYAEWPWVQALSEFHSTFGESRPQQLAERQPQLPDLQWHLIGRLQRNKARLAVKHAAVIHSVDSLRLLERLNVLAQESNRTLQVLLQVNVAGEASKSGFDPGSLSESWGTIVKSAGTRLKLIGLMTMAPQSDSPEAARPVFAELAALRQQLNVRSGRAELTELSMGMSSDFEVAIEEGATLIRIGSSLFDGLEAEDQ